MNWVLVVQVGVPSVIAAGSAAAGWALVRAKNREFNSSAASHITTSAVTLMSKLEAQVKRLEAKVSALTDRVELLIEEVEHWHEVAIAAKDEYEDAHNTVPSWWEEFRSKR